MIQKLKKFKTEYCTIHLKRIEGHTYLNLKLDGLPLRNDLKSNKVHPGCLVVAVVVVAAVAW